MWGKRRRAKRTKTWGFKSTIKKAPSKSRPASRKKWVAKVTRLTTRVLSLRIVGVKEVMTMYERLLRRREVEEITGMGHSSIYRVMRKGKFPRRVRIGPKAVRWRTSEITAWLKSLPVVGDEFGPADSA